MDSGWVILFQPTVNQAKVLYFVSCFRNPILTEKITIHGWQYLGRVIRSHTQEVNAFYLNV